MKKSLVIIMGLLIGALVYGELCGNEFDPEEGYIVDVRTVMDGDDDTPPLSQDDEGCDCRESEEDDCDDDGCECKCHQLEIE